MRPFLRWLLVLLLPTLWLAAPLDGAQKKADKDKDKEVTTEKMINSGVLVGKVAAVYEEKRAIRLQVRVAIPVVNPGAVQQVAQAQVQMAQARLTRNPLLVLQAQQSMALAQATLYNVQTQTQDVELKVVEDAVVRLAHPRPELDDKGRPKKMSRAQLKELKGPDPKQPGYKAEFGDVATEQMIQVTLVRKKPAPGSPAKAVPKKAKGKDGDGEARLDLLADSLPQISKIMILIDPPPAGG